jgi:hypothetical protein
MSDILDQINASLESEKLRNFLTSLFIDTRLSDKDQLDQRFILREPVGFDEAVEVADKYREAFPVEVRKSDPGLYRLSLEIENADDVVERLAIWSAHLNQIK